MKVAICTGSFACKVSSFGKQETVLIHTTVMSYTWQALWKKNKTKQRTGSVNYHTEYELPCVFHGTLWTIFSSEERCQKEKRGQKV